MDNERERKHDNEVQRERIKIENAHRVDQLIDLVQRHTRTERHLEQHSDITSLEQLKHTFKLQEEREGQIKHLKDIIISGEHDVDEKKHLQRNYVFTSNYLDHNSSGMDEETLEATREKQEHRKEQIEFMNNNNLF